MSSLAQKFLVRANRWHSVHSYNALISRLRRRHRDDYDMAMYATIGADSRENFERQGDGHVAVLQYHGLADGMSIYDLGCGCGRTAMALRRSGWKGQYKGADIVKPLVKYLNDKCPEYDAIVHRDTTISSGDESLDMIFHWSVFTHLYPEECYLYMKDSFRALKGGGKLVFSFLEFENAAHRYIFSNRVASFQKMGWSNLLDTFLHRDWIQTWAQEIGFTDVSFTDGTDEENHPRFFQALAVMTKPA